MSIDYFNHGYCSLSEFKGYLWGKIILMLGSLNCQVFENWLKHFSTIRDWIFDFSSSKLSDYSFLAVLKKIYKS